MPKVMIAIPTLDYIHRKFAESLAKLVQRLGDDEYDYFDVCFEGCTLVYISRDNLARKAIEGKYDWVLWLDADMVFEPDILYRLMAAKKDFVTGLYLGRHGTNRPCLFHRLVPPKRYETFEQTSVATAVNGIFQVEGCGFGCVLTKTEILRQVMANCGTCFRPTPDMGEDLAFCKRAMDLGYDIWANADVKAGHIAQCVVTPGERNEML